MKLPSQPSREKGQVIVLAAVMLIGVVLGAGLAIDVGMIMRTRTDLQKDADAMALAGAQRLCGETDCESLARTDAQTWGTHNAVAASDVVAISFGVDCDGTTSSNHDMITVRITRYQRSYFARVAGWEGGNVSACATARKFAIGGLGGVRPFGLEDDCIADITYGQTVVLKHDSDTTRNCDALQGNFGHLAIDGTGGDIVRHTIKHGSTKAICADSVPGCTDYIFATQTGDQIGPVKDGLKYIYDNTPEACDEWDEVIDGSGSNEKIDPDCNPWRSDYQAHYNTDATRLWVIPVVDGMWSSGGNNDIRIKAFAVVFLEDNSKCTGNSCDINARFIEAAVNIPGTDRIAYYDGANLTAVVLVE